MTSITIKPARLNKVPLSFIDLAHGTASATNRRIAAYEMVWMADVLRTKIRKIGIATPSQADTKKASASTRLARTTFNSQAPAGTKIAKIPADPMNSLKDANAAWIEVATGTPNA